MPRPAVILVPKSTSVRFPDRCPVCGKQSPGHEARADALLRPWTAISAELMAGWKLAICKEHEPRLRKAIARDALAQLGLIATALAVLVYLAGRFEMFADGWWSWAGVLLATLLLPQSLMAVIARPLFEVRPDDGFLAFTLHRRDYADELAALNEQ